MKPSPRPFYFLHVIQKDFHCYSGHLSARERNWLALSDSKSQNQFWDQNPSLLPCRVSMFVVESGHLSNLWQAPWTWASQTVVLFLQEGSWSLRLSTVGLMSEKGANYGGSEVKSPPATRETWVWSLGWEDSLEKGQLPTPVSLPRESHGQRSLAGHSRWGHKELDMTEWLSLTHSCSRSTRESGPWEAIKESRFHAFKRILQILGTGVECIVMEMNSFCISRVTALWIVDLQDHKRRVYVLVNNSLLL